MTMTNEAIYQATNGRKDSHCDLRRQGGSKTTAQLADPWPAPVASGPLNATVDVPGSKSLSNRYLIIAALGREPVTLHGLLRSRDTDLMAAALRGLGVGIEYDPNDDTLATVTPPVSGRFRGDVTVYCGLAGTVMRFVPSLALFADGPVHFDGDEQAYARPMHPVLDGLEQLGARVRYEGKPGFLPFTIIPPSNDDVFGHSEGGLAAGITRVSIDASASSQFISSLLLIGSRLPYGLELRHTGESLPSLPHIRMTMADVETAGGSIRMPQPGRWVVAAKPIQLPQGVVVEPDLSNAAPFLGAAMIAGGSVSVPDWPVSSTQPGALLPGILTRMGATVSLDGRPLTGNDDGGTDGLAGNDSSGAHGLLTVSMSGPIHGLGDGFDLAAAGEIAPSIAALATLADEPSALVGIGHLRGHETNRLAALVTEITRIGAGAEELPDGLRIIPATLDRLHGETMETYADHRMATFAAMIGLKVPGTRIRNVGTTRKTLPDFTGMWSAMLR